MSRIARAASGGAAPLFQSGADMKGWIEHFAQGG